MTRRWRFLFGSLQDPIHIRDAKVELRTPTLADFEGWADLREKSRDFLTPWEPVWQENDLTRSAFRARVRRYRRDIKQGTAYPFFIFEAGGGALLGGLTLTHVRRGVSQAASLGYWMGAPFAGRGYMSAAVRAVVGYAFEELRLHRVEAACLVHNTASIRLLERVGFKREGLARCYLCIAGEWQDHLLFALLRDDPRCPPKATL